MVADLSMIAGSVLSPEAIVREVVCLPSAPKVLPRLKQLLSDGNSATHEIVALIRLDPGIAARVLQMGNCAYFATGVRCFTVDEAVTRVGYDRVYELVAYAVASQVLVRPLDIYGIEADELWRMSVACALAAAKLSSASREPVKLNQSKPTACSRAALAMTARTRLCATRSASSSRLIIAGLLQRSASRPSTVFRSSRQSSMRQRRR